MVKLLTAKVTFFFFSKIFAYYAICNDDTLTNDIVSFKQLGPGHDNGYIFYL